MQISFCMKQPTCTSITPKLIVIITPCLKKIRYKAKITLCTGALNSWGPVKGGENHTPCCYGDIFPVQIKTQEYNAFIFEAMNIYEQDSE